MPAHSPIDRAKMDTLQEPWDLRVDEPTWNGSDGGVGTPTYSQTSDSEGTSESDSDLLSLFAQPEPNHPTREKRFDRGGRPFPYTRSKTRWRKRPSDEIKYLRGQLVELQTLKTALGNPDTKSIQRTGPRVSGVDEHTEALRKLHEEEDHSQKLDAALAENRKLHAMVAGRFQVAKALQDAIDEHVRLRAQKVYCSDGAAVPNELIFV
ncbi:Leucine-rich repeat serine/threonine-protein kinase 2 [Phytophthora pseudosyringae]|uniref:Leucine-rich repeat serine/threonine-protein kinase 2 n=1 Tax=Phytophthora pseudosyringae TaxID=221518 RepID=A0A8T1VUI1_9STRA|nr:Leucine-rich repeat serine/threonine-protein kinase 2 [Phytophthora pseudosyringae]